MSVVVWCSVVYRGVGGQWESRAGGSEACVTSRVGAKREMACEQRGAAKTAAGTTKDYPLLRDSQTDGMEQVESAGRVMTSRCDHAASFSPGLSLLTIISLKQRASKGRDDGRCPDG